MGSPAYTSYRPPRPSTSAPPLETSRSTQPSTVGNRPTSVLGATGAGAAAAVATWVGAIEPVVSLAGTAAAAWTGAAGGGARSLSTVSDSFAILAIGSACAFSSLSRRSLVRLNWPRPVLEVCSTLALSAMTSASIRATEDSSALVSATCAGAGLAKCIIPAVASAPLMAPTLAAIATTAAIADRRRLPPVSRGSSAVTCGANSSRSQDRSAGAMTMSLPGFGSDLVSGLVSALASNFGTSTLDASIFGGSILTGSGLTGSALGGASWSGAIEGASIPAAAAMACGVAAAASTMPVSWAVCSGIGSLTAQILQSRLTFW